MILALILLGLATIIPTIAFFMGKSYGRKTVQIEDLQDAVKEHEAYAKDVDLDTAHYDHIMERLRHDPSVEVQEIPAASNP